MIFTASGRFLYVFSIYLFCCSLLVLCENVFDALDFAIVSFTMSDVAIGACANPDVRRDAGRAFCVDGGMAIMDRLGYSRPWSF